MGLLIAQMRLAQINSYRSDLEYNVMLISSTKYDLLTQTNELLRLGSDMEPDSPEMKALEKRKERLNQAEKALDQLLQRYQTQLQMLEQEEQSVKEQLQSSIQRCFGR